MNLYLPLRAGLVSILVYVISFLMSSLVGKVVDVTIDDPTDIPPQVWYIGTFTAMVAMAIGSWFYFGSPHIQPSPLGGLAFGMTSILVGFALDSALMGLVAVGYNQPDQLPSLLFEYYLRPQSWLTLALIIAVATAMGYLDRSKPRTQS